MYEVEGLTTFRGLAVHRRGELESLGLQSRDQAGERSGLDGRLQAQRRGDLVGQIVGQAVLLAVDLDRVRVAAVGLNPDGDRAKAREIVQSGRLGRIVAVVGTALFHKRDDYFDLGSGWRRKPGGGPILINLIDDVNSLQSLVGDIVRVQATTSNAIRRFPVEDTVAMVFTFANGALGTFLLSDTAGSARSWEQTSHENTAFAAYDDEDCYHIAGTAGSLSIPTMRVKAFPGTPSWFEPFDTSTKARSAAIRWPTR